MMPLNNASQTYVPDIVLCQVTESNTVTTAALYLVASARLSRGVANSQEDGDH